MAQTVTLERLIQAREKVAQLVAYDLVYLPIFERLDSEVRALELSGDAFRGSPI